MLMTGILCELANTAVKTGTEDHRGPKITPGVVQSQDLICLFFVSLLLSILPLTIGDSSVSKKSTVSRMSQGVGLVPCRTSLDAVLK